MLHNVGATLWFRHRRELPPRVTSVGGVPAPTGQLVNHLRSPARCNSEPSSGFGASSVDDGAALKPVAYRLTASSSARAKRCGMGRPPPDRPDRYLCQLRRLHRVGRPRTSSTRAGGWTIRAIDAAEGSSCELLKAKPPRSSTESGWQAILCHPKRSSGHRESFPAGRAKAASGLAVASCSGREGFSRGSHRRCWCQRLTQSGPGRHRFRCGIMMD